MATEQKPEPIQQSVLVDCPIEDTFRLFTERFSEWWPLASHSITGDDADSCEIEPWVGGRLFERTRSGEELEWGSISVWAPPAHIQFTWHPDRADRSATVDVEFSVEADGTRVTVIHSGWEASGVPNCGSRFSKFVSEQVLMAV